MSSSEPTTLQPAPRPGAFWPVLWAGLFAVGLVFWIASLAGPEGQRAWLALLINLVYFNSLAVGMVVWSAVVLLSNGRWAGRAERLALGGVMFAPVPLLAFLVLWAGHSHWAVWMQTRQPHQDAWLNVPFLFTRDFLALLVLWTLAIVYVIQRRKGRPARLAGVFVFTYCIVASLLGFDLVMALDPRWYSTLFGGYFFITGMYIAVTAWTLLTVLRMPQARDQHHDLAKLMVAFSLISTYMMYSQLLPIWYENLPAEVRFIIPRLRMDQWGWLSAILLCTVYLGPLVFLLLRQLKRTPWYLGPFAAVILLGMWLERWWLVVPTVQPELAGRLALSVPELSATAAFLGAFGLCITLYNRWVPDIELAGPGPEHYQEATTA